MSDDGGSSFGSCMGTVVFVIVLFLGLTHAWPASWPDWTWWLFLVIGLVA